MKRRLQTQPLSAFRFVHIQTFINQPF